MAVSGLPAPPRRVLESFPEPPRAILERSETPPEHHKCVLEAINVSKRAPGRSKSRSGSSKDSLCNLSTIESASFPASISTFVACPSKKKPLRPTCGLCVPPRLRSPIGLDGDREAQTICLALWLQEDSKSVTLISFNYNSLRLLKTQFKLIKLY